MIERGVSSIKLLKKMSKSLVLLLLCSFIITLNIVSLASATIPLPPLWGGVSTFRVLVNLTNPDPITNWLFAYYHDSDLNAERYEHFPPQYDEMCTGLPYGSDQQCNVIFATNGWSYLQFPKVNFCCKCENQFGAVKGNWMEKNSTFVGVESLLGYQVQHWTKQGQYLNHYYCTNSDKIRIPIRFNELWGPKHILKQWDFKVETYNTKPFDRSLIDAPQNCENLCTSGVCAAYRK